MIRVLGRISEISVIGLAFEYSVGEDALGEWYTD